MIKKKIMEAKADVKGNISHVRLEGNHKFTSLETAIRLTKQGKVDAVVVEPDNAKVHLRTRPDGKINNNLDDMASAR